MCGREIDYTRNQVLLRAFKRIGDVDIVAETGATGSLIARSIRIAARAFPKVLFGRYDLIFVGFYGHLLMVALGVFTRKPKLFDAFVSNYDSLTSDRKTYKPDSLFGRLALLLDRLSCRLATKVLVDTPAHEEYFSSGLGIPKYKLSSLPVSCNEDIFYPRPSRPANEATLVLNYSTYLPTHGIETILRAAQIVKDESIHFKLIGKGPLYQQALDLAKMLELDNVTFTPPVSLEKLAEEIAMADICLGGHFGKSEKATRVIPGKIYQMIAMGKPIIAANSLANQELLCHESSTYLCPPDDPDALATAILTLYHNPKLCAEIGSGARAVFKEKCSETIVTEKLRNIIMEMLSKNSINAQHQ